VKLKKTGLILAGINVALTLLIAVLEFSAQAKGNTSGGWLFLFPVLWNLPISLFLMLLASFQLPEWLLLGLLIFLGSVQWYAIGWAIESFAAYLRRRSAHPDLNLEQDKLT
jgi:hypothetical protein